MRKLLTKLKKISCREGEFSCQFARTCLPDYRIFQLKSANIGSILIEFVFCVPVIIILLFFVNDHFRFYELKSKIKTSAYLAASMIQQVENTKSGDDKQLTKKILSKICLSSCMNLFHTKAMYQPYPFGIWYKMTCTYVRRENSTDYTLQIVHLGTNKLPPTSGYGYVSKYYSPIITDPETVKKASPDLLCDNDGDEKVMVWSYYMVEESWYDKSKLGLFVLPLHYTTISENKSQTALGNGYFQHKVIFTPKPGLFPVKNE